MGTDPLAGRWLWVLRHAKAAAHAPDDHGRPLTRRGERQAAELARHIAEDDLGAPPPTTVLASSARRARQTAELVSAGLVGAGPGPGAELVVERALYDADADDVVDRLRALPDDAASVMVVGHNPTAHELVLLLLEGDDAEGRRRLDAGFPTAALAVVGFGARPWAAVAAGTGTLLHLWTPPR